ncbi:hypothetical protein RRG08_056031 [Elysia crispata]|uniref:Uncharacterized protein n=1 Tax=Elysia crispata TaxID=231223 RepID=A0AAE1AGB7_9GAST|nr:hypothetical protein RRG08_056031 [Elysia crispata]
MKQRGAVLSCAVRITPFPQITVIDDDDNDDDDDDDDDDDEDDDDVNAQTISVGSGIPSKQSYAMRNVNYRQRKQPLKFSKRKGNQKMLDVRPQDPRYAHIPNTKYRLITNA